MDPNREELPPKAELDAVEVEVVPIESLSPPPNPPLPPAGSSTAGPSSIEPLSSSSIFRDALRQSEPLPLPPKYARPDDETRLNEEEFQRRLKGEYEAAQKRLGDVVSDNMTRPLTLSSIRLSPPPKSTRPGFIRKLLSPFLTSHSHPWLPKWAHPAPPPPQTLHDVLLTTRALVAHLDKFGIWDMDRASVRLEPVLDGNPDEVELVLGLVPRGRFFMKVGTSVGAGEGTGDITARTRNALGGGETLEVVGSAGTTTRRAYQASLTTPLLASPLFSLALSGFSQDRDNSFFASHREELQGARARLSAICPWGTHDLTYELVKRDITHLAPRASVSIRELANPSTKSSLLHTWTSDTRDDPWTGRSGRLLKLVTEYAGLPGSSSSVHFLKNTAQANLSRALYPGSNITFSLSGLTTLLYPLTSTPTQLPDRTFLGGPNSIRGWKTGGLGPRDGLDSIGGDLSWAFGLSVFAPIPRKEHWPLKLHSYLNLGKVVGWDHGRGLVENIERAGRSPNVSAGIGLMLRIEPLRIEFNFGMPLVARRGERLQRGFDLGVGVEFL